MAREIFYKITQFDKFQWNTRLYEPVWPKYHVFVQPIYGDKLFNAMHRNHWLDFLMTNSKKTSLFLFTIRCNFTRIEYRDLINWKGMELEEGMIPVSYKGSTQVLRRQRIYRSQLRQKYLEGEG